MKWEYCYIYSFFITSNITVSSLLTFQEHTEVLQESPDLLSLFPLSPLRKRSGPQTTLGQPGTSSCKISVALIRRVTSAHSHFQIADTPRSFVYRVNYKIRPLLLRWDMIIRPLAFAIIMFYSYNNLYLYLIYCYLQVFFSSWGQTSSCTQFTWSEIQVQVEIIVISIMLLLEVHFSSPIPSIERLFLSPR